MREIHEEAVRAEWLSTCPSRATELARIELLDEAMVEVFRRKTPVERVAMIFGANRTMRLRLEGHLRSRHPEWDDQTVIGQLGFTETWQTVVKRVRGKGEIGQTGRYEHRRFPLDRDHLSHGATRPGG